MILERKHLNFSNLHRTQASTHLHTDKLHTYVFNEYKLNEKPKQLWMGANQAESTTKMHLYIH